MRELQIRKATAADAAALAELGRKTFYEKWKGTTSEENMHKYLDETYTISRITGELEHSSNTYLIAEQNNHAVAFAKLMRTHPDIEIPHPEVQCTYEKPLEISRLYVSPELIGKQIGAALMKRIFEIAREEHCDLIWLGVWEQNPAVRFYERQGFVKAGTHKFILGEQVDIDLVMVKSL